MNPFCREAAHLAPLTEGSPLEDGRRQAQELDKRAAVAEAYSALVSSAEAAAR